MATINLACSGGHDFEVWFRSSADFEKQREARLVSCPWCGSNEIERRLSVPNVISGSRRKDARRLASLEAMANAGNGGNGGESNNKANTAGDNRNSDSPHRDGLPNEFLGALLNAPASMLAVAQELRRLHAFVDENCDDVGYKFAEEARRRHEENFLAAREDCNSKETSNKETSNRAPRGIRGIRGKASIDELRSLHEEGIAVTAIPPLPSSYN